MEMGGRQWGNARRKRGRRESRGSGVQGGGARCGGHGAREAEGRGGCRRQRGTQRTETKAGKPRPGPAHLPAAAAAAGGGPARLSRSPQGDPSVRAAGGGRQAGPAPCSPIAAVGAAAGRGDPPTRDGDRAWDRDRQREQPRAPPPGFPATRGRATCPPRDVTGARRRAAGSAGHRAGAGGGNRGSGGARPGAGRGGEGTGHRAPLGPARLGAARG